MNFVSLVITLIVIGVVLGLINSYIPMDSKIKNILNIVVVICVIAWLLNVFGIIDIAGNLHIPSLKS